MNYDLAGRLAIVTGATRGIGREIALQLAAQDARLVIMGRDKDALRAVAEQCGGRVVAIEAGDVANPETAQRVQEQAEHAGGCDILLNVAGVFPTARLADIDDELARRTIDTNFFGVFNFCRAIIPGMVRRGSGSVVNVTSLAARAPAPGLSVYSAAKAGVEAFSRSVALEVAPTVRVNCLSPGPTWTETVGRLATEDQTGAVEEVTRSIPLGRYGDVAELASAALFLAAGPGSTWMTGQTMHVNGGAFMG